MTAPAFVYLFCFLACAVCSGLLVRSWLKTRTSLLLWTAASFVMLAVNNLLLFADTTLLPDIDLTIFRQVTAMAAISILVFGLIWEAD